MDEWKGWRGSARQAARRSSHNHEPDYTSSSTMAHFDQAEQLFNALMKSEERKKKAIAQTSRSRPVKASTQTRGNAKKLECSSANVKAASKAAATRVVPAKNKVTKPKPAPKKTQTAAKMMKTRHQRTHAPAKPAITLPISPNSAPKEETLNLTWASRSSRESSTVSDAPSNILSRILPSGAQASVSPQAAEPVPTAAPPDSQMSLNEIATLTGDMEMEDSETSEDLPGRGNNEVITPATPPEDNIIVEHSRSIGTRNAPIAPERVSPQPPAVQSSTDVELNRLLVGDSESTVPRLIEQLLETQRVPQDQAGEGEVIEVKQTRRRTVTERHGAWANSASIDTLPPLPVSDKASQEDDASFSEPPGKKQRTSSVSKRTPRPPLKSQQTPKKAESTTKRGNARPEKASMDVKPPTGTVSATKSKIITISATPSALKNVLQTPPRSISKTPRKTPFKRPREPASKLTPKTPTAPVFPPTPESIAAEPVQPETAVDPAILALSRELTAREPLGSKPQAEGQPLVWAESRQALCETLPYFKRPQGGCYQNDSHVYGFLFDSVGHCREYLDEDIIICRAGGSMEQDPSGGMVQKKDQSMKEAQVQAIINDIAHQNPLIVICGNRNGGAKCEMPHQYSVLGWYKPVAVWEEKTAGRGKKTWTTIKYRLERLNQAGEPVPWHAPAGFDLAAFRSSASLVHRQNCQYCGKAFDQVYLQGWMCLNSACDQFWKINGSSAPLGATGLDYNPDFLLSRAPAWGDESEPAPVRPPIPDVGNAIGDDLAYINTRGICCPKCGRCNSRRLFDRWICENPICDYELRPQHRPVLPTHLHTPWDVAPTLVRNKVEPGVHLNVEHKYGYKVCTYTFDGIDGRFIHAAATKAILGASDGPDQMMANLQSEDLGLERRVFAVTKMSGGRKAEEPKPAPEKVPNTLLSPPMDQQPTSQAFEDEEPVISKRKFDEGDLMTAFSMNYGMPYKFVASGASRSFESSPKAVNDCRYRLNWAARTLLGKSKDALDFNEELIFTYLEGQKIEYHDDGEDGLGPEIASLSLGGRAKMHMRMKAKHFVGCSKTGILAEEKPMPGSIDGAAMYEKRLAAWEELQRIKSDSTAYNKRRKELPKELGIFDKRMKKADDLVTVTLSHGDIMVMDGYDIQKYLEHKVVPEGYLRFALTCRTVLEDHLKPEERPDYVVRPDEGMYDGSVGY